MKPYDRLYAAAHFEEYDRPPFSDNEWNELLGEMTPVLAGCAERGDRRYSDEERAAAVRSSMDMVPWHAIYDHPRYPILGLIPNPREGERWVDEDGFGRFEHGYTSWIETRPFSNMAGFLDYLKRKEQLFRDDDPRLSQDFPARLAAARRMLGDTCIALPYLGAGLDGLYPAAGWEIFAQVVAEAPESIMNYLDALAGFTVKLVHLYAAHITARDCPVALGAYSDIAYNTGLLVSPRFLRLALIPAVRKITTAYHEHGIKVVYHSEGDLRKILPDLIAAGVDGINPLSPSERMDAVEIRRLYPRLILWGGIDERAVLVDGDPEGVRHEVQRIVAGVGRGLILSSSGGVHPACSLDNCLAMVSSLQEMSTPFEKGRV
jgi:hypothetical protein